MRPILTFLVTAACLVGGSADAQWQWLDKNGHKVFSDQPPPNDIAVRNILKQPGKAVAAQVAPATAHAPAATASAANGPLVPALVLNQDDKTLQAKKAKAEAEAEAKIDADEQAKAQIKATNCEKARKSKALMDSGTRVSITNARGEREILDDEARGTEQKKISRVIEDNCD